MLDKHAYLIMAHNQFELLERLIHQLDDKRNDLYIHIDKKAENFDFKKFKQLPLQSKIYFLPSMDVKWGGYSQIECELLLLKEATKNNYRYYHLLSGADLPLKTQNYIHDFFDKYDGMEFIHFSKADKEETKRFTSRISRYHFFQEYSPKSNSKLVKAGITIMDKLCLIMQRLIGINRLRNEEITVKFGSSWFSITNDFANYILSQEKWIKKHFSYSKCADELFLQTLIYQSSFEKELGFHYFKEDHLSNMRKIEWSKTTNSPNPEIWTVAQTENLIEADHLFARKFDLTVDSTIVDQICDHLDSKKNYQATIKTIN